MTQLDMILWEEEHVIDNQVMYEAPHRRWNLLSGEWVQIAPQRTLKSWQQSASQPSIDDNPICEPTCSFCPGYEWKDGQRTPHYKTTFVIDDDEAALLPDIKTGSMNRAGLLIAASERGICRLVSHSPRHDHSFADMDILAIRQTIDAWASQSEKLGRLPWVKHIQIYSDQCTVNGASSVHPHVHIQAHERIPCKVGGELREQRGYLTAHKSKLLRDYLELELDLQQRIVCWNTSFAVVVPFWASWPFETLVLPAVACGALTDLSPDERNDLSDILHQIFCRYKSLFKSTLHCNMSIDQRPADDRSHPEWQFHIHCYPPLLRPETPQPCIAGYDLFDQRQPIPTPEEAAQLLRGALDYA